MKGATDHGIRISAFPPIGDYAFLSDCETSALVAPNGNVEWLCLPRMDSPSVFGAILDRDAGGFRVGPADVNVPAARRYIPGTMVLETTWETRMGWVIVSDALSVGPWHHRTERSRSHRRSPTDHDADHVMLRLIECVQGSVEIKVDIRTAGAWTSQVLTRLEEMLSIPTCGLHCSVADVYDGRRSTEEEVCDGRRPPLQWKPCPCASALLLRLPVICTSAVHARRCSIGCLLIITAGRSCCAWRIPIRRVIPRKQPRPFTRD